MPHVYPVEPESLLLLMPKLLFLQYLLFEEDSSSTHNNNFIHGQIYEKTVEFGKWSV
jgi:hypothetical protein